MAKIQWLRHSHPRLKAFGLRLALYLLGSFIIACAGLFVWTLTPAFDRFVTGQARAFLTQRTQGEVRLEGIDAELALLQFEVRGLEIGGRSATDPPMLSIPKLFLSLDWLGLLRQSIVVSRLELERPAFYVRLGPDGKSNWPSFGAGGGGGGSSWKFAIRRCQIRQLELTINDDLHPIDLDLRNLDIDLAHVGGDRPYRGKFSFYAPGFRYKQQSSFPLRLLCDFALGGGRVFLQRLDARLRQTQVQARGQILDLASPRYDLEVNARYSIDEVRDIFDLDTRLGGRGSFSGNLRGHQGHFVAEGSWAAQRIAAWRVDVDRARGRVRWERGDELNDVEVPESEAWLAGGHATGGFATYRGQPRRFECHFDFSDFATPEILRQVQLGGLDFGGRLSGRGQLSWRSDHFADLEASGELHSRPDPAAPGELQLGFDLYPTIAARRVRFQASRVRLPGSTIALRGELAFTDRSNLAVSLQSQNLEPIDRLIAQLRALAGDGVRPELLGLGGGFDLQGTFDGSVIEPALNGDFRGRGLHYAKVPFGAAQGKLRYTHPFLAVSNARFEQRGSVLAVDGRFRLGSGGDGSEDIRAEVLFARWPGATLMRLFEVELPVQASVSGRSLLRGQYAALQGDFDLELGAGRAFDESFDRIESRLHLELPELVVERLVVHKGGGTVRGHGKLDWGPMTYSLDLRGSGLPLHDFQRLAKLPALEPTIANFELSGSGSLQRPQLRARARIEGLTLGASSIGGLELGASWEDPEQIVLRASLPQSRIRADAALALRAPLTVRGHLALDHSDLSPLLALTRLPNLQALALRLGGGADFELPLLQPSALQLTAELPDFRIARHGIAVEAAAPLRLRLEQGRLHFERGDLRGPESSFSVTGAVELAAPRLADLTVRGDLNLMLLSAFYPDASFGGTVKALFSLQGPILAPNVTGTLDVDGGYFKLRDFPHPAEQIRANLSLRGGALQINSLQARMAEGTIAGAGRVGLDGFEPSSYSLRLFPSGLKLRYPEGTRYRLSGALRLEGDPRTRTMDGEVTIEQGRYTRPILLSDLTQVSDTSTPGRPNIASPFLGEMKLDVQVNVVDPIAIKNPSMDLSAIGNLELRGTPNDVLLLGHVEILEDGELRFQDNLFRVVKGSFDFENPYALDPFFDFRATTERAGYLVTLRFSRSYHETARFELTSDPPLRSQLEIVTLLSTGQVPTGGPNELRQTLSPAATEVLEQIFLGQVQEQAEERLGLASFRINPLAIDANDNPTARLTLERELTQELNVVYSIDLARGEEQVVLLRLKLSPGTFLQASRQADGSFGIDLRRERRF
ncbi:MAG TPA: translocation/assembly module TamB domain-containing protein [Acidobacteriota bacterium]